MSRPFYVRNYLQWCGLIFLLSPATGGAADLFPGAAASYLISTNHSESWSHQPERRLPPASLTKIMTVLLAVEHSQPQDAVTIGPDAATETGSRLGLRVGEQFRVVDLLAASLLQSANDACHALADHIAGNESNFVALMNRRAKELGLADTRFSNACGHDHPNHYSSARDLARLADSILAHPFLAELVSRVETTISTLDGRHTFRLVNRNELVGRYQGVAGVKTGYTPKAGKCLIALARRNGAQVMVVLLNAPDRWWTAVDMLDSAFAAVRSPRTAAP